MFLFSHFQSLLCRPHVLHAAPAGQRHGRDGQAERRRQVGSQTRRFGAGRSQVQRLVARPVGLMKIHMFTSIRLVMIRQERRRC